MTSTRTDIFRAIDRWPGIHFNELVRRLDLAPGQVQHHINVLQDDGRVVREPLFGRTHYYAPSIDEADRAAIALLRRETPRAMMSCLLEEGPMPARELATELDLANSTVSYHVDRLEQAALVEREQTLRNADRLRIADPQRIESLLAHIVPDPSARLTDRFERLVDELVDE